VPAATEPAGAQEAVAPAPAAEAATQPAEPAAAAAEPAAASSSRITAPAKVIEDRWYISPMGSYALPDEGRHTKDGHGGAFAVGRSINEEIAVEVSGQYSKLKPATLYGVGANVLFFPTKKSFYALIGAGFGHASKHPGLDPNYDTVLFNFGLGYMWGAFQLLGHDVMIRTEALYRLDAHSTTRTGTSAGNGRRAFNDGVFNVGLLIPFGEGKPPVTVPAPEPAEAPQVVEAPALPAPVEEAPAAPAPPPCKTPAPGEKVDLSGCAAGDVIVLRGVNFEFNKATLTADARTILDGVVDALKAAPAVQIEVGGHTDGKGGEAYNLKLSQKRAESVQTYLVGHGIAPVRMTAKGYGKSQPVADNATDEGREQNRRVELKIVGGSTAVAPAAAAESSAPSEAAPAEASPAN
jgi:OOP family OmpA-OmpF porin